MQTILFHGPSGSGKDTQVDLLVQKYEFENIGTGEMFRRMYKEGDIEAIRAYQYWSKGQFVPNELTYSILNRWVQKFDTEKSWGFVSVVRDEGQIPLFDDLLKNNGRELDFFVHFVLSEEMAIERMSLRRVCSYCEATYHQKYKPEKVSGYCDRCGTKLIQREDDQPDKIIMRLKEYNKSVIPIVNTYKERGLLLEIDASPSIEVIHSELIQRLGL
jgi:adenylate kinase